MWQRLVCALLIGACFCSAVEASHLRAADIVFRVAALVERDDATAPALLDGYKFWQEQVNEAGGIVVGRARYSVDVTVFDLDGTDAQAFDVSIRACSFVVASLNP
jgi:hypothetical protein